MSSRIKRAFLALSFVLSLLTLPVSSAIASTADAPSDHILELQQGGGGGGAGGGGGGGGGGGAGGGGGGGGAGAAPA
jgi:hypothetical protein